MLARPAFRFALLLMLAWLAAAPAAAQVAGRIVLAVGDVAAVRGAERVRLAAGANVGVGDTIFTAAQSHAQVRFGDNSLVALKPESEFRIEAWSFGGSAGTDRATFRLVKGGFRTLTGSIGQVNREQYQVLTTQATIGIRGTHYLLQICAADNCLLAGGAPAAPGLWGGVLEGRIAAGTPFGDAEFGEREYFRVPDGGRPERIIGPPAFLAGTLGRPPGGERQPVGNLVFTKVPEFRADLAIPDPPFKYLATEDRNNLPSGAPQTIVVGSDRYTLELDATSSPGLALGVDGSGRLVSFVNANLTADVGTASIVDTGQDGSAGGVNWGRWAGAGSTITQKLPNGDVVQNGGGNLHYVYGNTAVDLPTSGQFSYTPVGGTRPTDSSGTVGTLISAGRVDVNFTPATASLSGLAVGFTQSTYTMSGTANILDGRFSTSGTGAVAGCTGSGCQSLVGGNFVGFFAGPGGAGIGLDYFFNLRSGNVLEGVTGYRKCPSAAPC
ncbi:MAG: FecR family protein [Betaproteobacteria bacterium]